MSHILQNFTLLQLKQKGGVIYLLATKARSITNFFSLSSHQKLKIQLWASSKKWAFKTIHSLSWCQKFSSSSPWTAPQLRRTFAYYYIKATIAAKAILLLTTPSSLQFIPCSKQKVSVWRDFAFPFWHLNLVTFVGVSIVSTNLE